MQEVTGSIPVISTRKRKHCTEMCGAFLFYLPFTLTTPFVKNAFVALRRVLQTQNINNRSSDHAQSGWMTPSDAPLYLCSALIGRLTMD